MAALPLLLALALAEGPPIGFVSHYPLVRAEDETYGASGATVALVRAPWGEMQPSPEAWNDALIDEQLTWARQQGIRLIYVIECGPAHCVNWVREEVRAAGELTCDHRGATNDPSIFSPVYGARMDAFIERAVRAIERKDQDGLVLGYSNGCEWWYPSGFTFAEPDRLGFEKAMRARYGSDRAAREAWGLPGEGRLERPPVVFDGLGGADRLGELVPIDRVMDSSWSTLEASHVPVEAGQSYTFEALTRVAGSGRRGGAYLEVAWLPEGSGKPMRLSQSERIPSTDGWRPLRIEADAPAGCDRAWLLLKSSAEADVTFREVHFRAAGSDGERTPNAALDPQAGAWGFTAWSAGQEDALRSEWDPGELRIRYAPRDDHAVPARWVEDWFDFTGDALAEFIGHVADGIRAAAPGKPIIAYLTFAFAAPFNWDYSYDTNVHPPKVFAARRYEGLGMQLSAADGDYHHVTAGIDMVRHLGDPWMIDLQDFTSGVAIGAPAMTETTRAGIAAGARGAVYYCWYGTPDYNFHRDWPDGDVRAMVLSGRDLLGETAATTVPVDVALLHPMRVPYEGAGERDPGRFYLLYGACRRLGLGIRIVTRREDAPEGVPLLTVDDVPRPMHVHLRRTTEAGNTPPMFKRQAGESCTAQSIAQLAEALAGRLGLTMPPRDTERFPVVGADGVRRDVGVARVPWVRAPW